MQTSTVISDFILAAVAAWTGFRLHGNWNKRSGAWGFYSIAIGAALGSLFFAGVTVIEPIYRIVIGFAAQVGVPWIGLAFFYRNFREDQPQELDYDFSFSRFTVVSGSLDGFRRLFHIHRGLIFYNYHRLLR